MTAALFEHFLFFRTPFNDQGKEISTRISNKTEEKSPAVKENILCRNCRHPITAESMRIEVQGGHEHTFANPQGLLFEIGCFTSAPGCEYIGTPSNEFSWFSGFSWRVAICGSCNIHNGWLFLSSGEKQFAGLILNRLIFLGNKNR